MITLWLEPQPLMRSLSFSLPPPLTSSSHLLSPVVRGRERERGRERGSVVKLEQDGNKEDGYSGPTLTHTSPGLNYTCVSGGSVQMWRESHSSSDPPGRQASGWAGEGGGGCIHLGPPHITCMTDVKRPCACSLSLSLSRAHSALPGSIRHSVMMGGHLSLCAAGACLAGEARKAMALFSCKKLKNLPSVQWWRWGGLGRGERWRVNK